MPQKNRRRKHKKRFVNPKDLKPARFRREAVPDVQLEQFRDDWRAASQYQETAFETLESDFLRDATADDRFAAWICFAHAMSRFMEQHPETTKAERKSILSCFLLISMGYSRPENIDEGLWQYLIFLSTPQAAIDS